MQPLKPMAEYDEASLRHLIKECQAEIVGAKQRAAAELGALKSSTTVKNLAVSTYEARFGRNPLTGQRLAKRLL